CNQTCGKMLSCGQHVCILACCDDPLHLCPEPCGRQLPCGLHFCEDRCHKGKCRKCSQWVYTSLVCACGSTSVKPPRKCGDKSLPLCSNICRVPPPCGHQPIIPHSCHPRSIPCPPCIVICDKTLRCGKHRCSLP
ncbi:hypothetical protein GUITHDRAFT_56311, partial [Guillardia theta CCMP2712]